MFQVLEAWKNLLEAAEGRRLKLVDTGDKFRFFSMVRDLMLWMEDVIRLIEAQENPRSDPEDLQKKLPFQYKDEKLYRFKVSKSKRTRGF